MRINAWISKNSLYSRRKVDELILAGEVEVNGERVTTPGIQVTPQDKIRVKGTELYIEENKIYILLNKPKGYISSTSDELGRKTILNLIEKIPTKIFPVGRLDYNTTGLILITNDGVLADKLTSPKTHIAKKYQAKVTGKLTDDQLKHLERAVIPQVKSLPCKIKKKSFNHTKNQGILEVTIFEGKNHQVKKMFEHVNSQVTALERIEYGPFILNKEPIKRGAYRFLKPQEIKNLKTLCGL